MGDDKILTITEQIVQKLRHDIYSEKLQSNLPLKETEDDDALYPPSFIG